jgi:drug/metabolite transporter (DMT)-like permease
MTSPKGRLIAAQGGRGSLWGSRGMAVAVAVDEHTISSRVAVILLAILGALLYALYTALAPSLFASKRAHY